MTTPAMNLPRPSVTPEAVRISVSMRSLITFARAGITEISSFSVACRQPAVLGRPGLAAESDKIARAALIFRLRKGLIPSTVSIYSFVGNSYQHSVGNSYQHSVGNSYQHSVASKLIGRIGCCFRPAPQIHRQMIALR